MFLWEGSVILRGIGSSQVIGCCGYQSSQIEILFTMLRVTAARTGVLCIVTSFTIHTSPQPDSTIPHCVVLAQSFSVRTSPMALAQEGIVTHSGETPLRRGSGSESELSPARASAQIRVGRS